MASSTVPGDRRWASARRGGMTVLGKVAVPKPINLPSQKLENHGLDPNVEIVPKGTLSWGSKSSSSAPNAWASSTLSPTAEAGANSPSRLSARPSSGESGTRPSTAGSDRALDTAPNAWGSSSRPSSASGTLSSSQTSLASLRPRSAETRPGSSQLSRFAEPSSDNSVTGSGERLGVTSYKNDGFSLSSGDFPVLGSEKISSGKNASSQGEESAEERMENLIVDASVNADSLSKTESSWRQDNPPQIEDDVRPSMEKWPGDPRFPNSGIPPQHFNGWHGPPVTNPPGGVWYRGPPGAPPYGPPVGPGGFPMEPFPFYRPQMPAAGLPNPPPVAPSGAGPRGPRPRGGDMYRPQVPDSYIRPGMPMRPRFFSGPIRYDGYFGPPLGYCNPNERDIPFMGVPNGPPSVYGRYPGHHAPEISNPHPRSVGYCSDIKAPVSEVEPGHHLETLGDYKVLLKHHNEWDGNHVDHKTEEAVAAGKTCQDMGDFSQSSSWENDWTVDHKKDEVKHSATEQFGEVSYQRFDSMVGASSLPMEVQSHENAENVRVDGSTGRRLEYGHSVHPEVVPPSVAASKDSSLIQKIEGLNAKARSSDGKHDNSHFASRPEQDSKKFLAGDSRSSHFTAESAQHPDRTAVPGNLNHTSLETSIVSGGSSSEQSFNGANASRKHPHGVQGKSHYHGKGRFNTHDADGWRKKSSPAVSLDVVPAMPLDTSSSHMQAYATSPKAKDLSGSHDAWKDGVESVPAKSNQHANQAERAKMKELAKQRAKQRQEEEEERIKDQKAKALMKLEELNKRTQVGEGSNPRPDNVSADAFVNKPPNSRPDSEIKRIPVQEDVGPTDLVEKSTAPSVNDVSASKQRRVADKQKQCPPLDKNLSTESRKVDADAANDTSIEIFPKERASSSEANLPVRPHHVADASTHQRRKSNKNTWYKHKADEVPPVSSLSSAALKETSGAITLEENSKVQDSELAPSAAGSLMDLTMENQPSEPLSTLANEETQTRSGHQGKPQHSRRPARNPQVNRSTEKFHGGEGVVWAPVRSPKIETADEASDKTLDEGLNSSAKSDQTVHNPKNKRAEMERYVPKPVAKEMALQGSIHQQMADSSNKNLTDESGQKGETNYQAIENIPPTGSTIGKESKNVEGRHNKPGRSQGSWRQRGSAESNTLQGPVEGQSSSSGLGKGDKMRVEHQQSHNPEGRSPKEQAKVSHEWCSNDGPDFPGDSNSVAQVTSYVAREHGTAGKGKRQPFRGQKGTGTNANLDQTKTSDDAEKNQSLAAELGQTAGVASKENPSVGERSMAHWQPKSQNFSSHNHRRSRPIGVRVDDSSRDEALHQQHKEALEASAAPGHDRDTSAKDNVGPVGNFETKRGRKAHFSGGRPHSPIQDSVKVVDSGPEGEDGQQEARTSSGFRKNSNQNSRFGRGNEYRGEWNSSGQDNRQQNMPGNRERQRQNSNYKYQPVGAFGYNRSDYNEGPKDGSHSTGTKFKERGSQSYNRRGGGSSHEWRGGNTGADGGHSQ